MECGSVLTWRGWRESACSAARPTNRRRYTDASPVKVRVVTLDRVHL